MEYNDWIMELFEEFYPRYDLPYGFLKWNKNEELLEIFWGNKSLKLNPQELYNIHSDHNPVESVLTWIYNNVEPTRKELEEAFFTYDFDLDSYSAYVLRPMDTCYIVHRTAQKWAQSQDSSRLADVVQADVSGSIINFSSKNSRLPASMILAYKKYTIGVIEKYMDYSPDISIIVPDTKPLSNIFIGHPDSIHRLGSDYPTDKISIFTLGQWLDKTNERFIDHE